MPENIHTHLVRHLPLGYVKHKAILNAKGEAVDIIFQEVNKSFEKLTKLSSKTIKNQKLRNAFPHITREDFQWMLFYFNTLKEGESKEIIKHCSIYKKWFRITMICLGHSEMLFLYDDFTVRKKVRQVNRDIKKQQKLLFELSSSKHYTEGNIYDFIKLVTEKSTELFQVWRTGVWFFDEDGEKLRCFDTYDGEIKTHHSGTVLSGIKYNPEYFYLQKNKYIDAHDALTDERVKGYLEKYIKPLRITSMLDVGILNEGTPRGVLCIEQKGIKRKWAHHEISFACQVADQIAIVLSLFYKKIAQKELDKTQAKIETIYSANPSGIGFVADRIITEVNEKVCQMTGYTREELIGTNTLILYPDKRDYEMAGREIYRQVEESGHGMIETRWQTKQGNVIHILLNAAGINPENPAEGIAFSATDISRRKTAEEKLKENDIKLRKLASNIPGAVYQFNITPRGDFKLLFMSGGGSEIYEKPISVLQNFEEVFKNVCPEHKQPLEKSIRKAAAEFSDWKHEFCITTETGKRKWLRGMSKPRREPDDGIVWDGVLLDITNQKKMEEQLRQNEKRYQSVVNTQRELISRFTTDTTLTFVNHAYCHFFGKTREEMLEKKFLDFFPPETHKNILEHLRLFSVKSPSHSTKSIVLTPDGEKVWVEWHTLALFADDETITEFQSIGQDITDSRKKQELEQELQLAVKSAEFKKNFLANMSHEMRTPLTGIIGMTDMLEKTRLNKRQREFVGFLKNSGENLLEIINQVLDFSRIEQGKAKLNYRTFPVQELSTDAENLFKSICQKPIAFELSTDSSLPSHIKADQTRIEQIIHNLLSNAVKFTNQGKIMLRIQRVKQQIPGNGLTIKVIVTDTGRGIPAQKHRHIFEPFIQFEDHDTRVYEGTGLGLSISKKLAEMHGGEIGFDSKWGKGSTFWFTFNARAEELQSGEDKSSRPKPKINQLNILFAEDKKVNQQVVKLILNSMGHRVVLAENGDEALDKYSKERFDLILLDIQMPVMDGITTMKKLKMTYKKLPPIIGLSANAFEGDKEKYTGQGMDAYLTKPIKKETLEEMLISFFQNK